MYQVFPAITQERLESRRRLQFRYAQEKENGYTDDVRKSREAYERTKYFNKQKPFWREIVTGKWMTYCSQYELPGSVFQPTRINLQMFALPLPQLRMSQTNA